VGKVTKLDKLGR